MDERETRGAVYAGRGAEEMAMRNMRLMRRAAPPARAAHEMAMRNMRWMRRAAPGAAQMETPASQARRGPLRGGVAFLLINELVVRDRLLVPGLTHSPAANTQPRRGIADALNTLAPVRVARAVAAPLGLDALEADARLALALLFSRPVERVRRAAHLLPVVIEEHRLFISTAVAHLLLLRRRLVELLHGLRQLLDVGLAEALREAEGRAVETGAFRKSAARTVAVPRPRDAPKLLPLGRCKRIVARRAQLAVLSIFSQRCTSMPVRQACSCK